MGVCEVTMPANLTLQYLQAEERFRNARTREERIAALEDMIRELPKHKGTEKMYADLKTRLSKLRKEDESEHGRRSSGPMIEREGIGQVIVIGAPNSGKSALVAALTNAPVEVTDYPFATRKAIPGMMRYEDVRIQLVDTPSLSADFKDPGLMPLVRAADAAALVVDLGAPDCLDQPVMLIAELSGANIEPVKGTVEETPKHGSPRRIPAMFVGTRADHQDAPTAVELLREVIGERLPFVSVSVSDAASLAAFARACFDMFGVVRAYSKQPGKDPDMGDPFILPKGSSVLDLAEKIHRDLRERFAYARVWGGGRYQGQRVARDYVVQDKDIVEIHTA